MQVELAIRRELRPTPTVALGHFLYSADGVYAVDETGRVIYFNEVAEQILGLNQDEVIGQRCSEVMSGLRGDGRPICSSSCHSLAAARRGQMLRHDDLVVRDSQGRPVTLCVNTLTLRSPSHEFQAMVHVVRDAGREKRAELLFHKLVKALDSELEPAAMLASTEQSPVGELTRREIQVLRLLADGANTKAVAEQLSISPATARHHIDSIMSKLGVHSRLEAVAYALRHHLIKR